MSLQQLLQASLPTKREESKPVSPTLLVGMGGTGKEVLLRLRRLIVERYGSLSRLPFVQFIHLDTDSTISSREQYDLRAGDDPLDSEVRFRPTERIDLTIDGGTGRYIQHLKQYPHVKRWFPVGAKIMGLGNLGDGAGQIRVAGRLGLYHATNFGRIAARLDQCKGLLGDASILQKSSQLGFDFDPQGMNVFVVASLAGGTGSGTFLDMGYLLRRYFPRADRIGLLMLPGFYTGYAGAERVRANGYAALMELNHYAFGHEFLADWDGTGGTSELPPPFSTTYLIDGLNEAGLAIGSSGKEYDAYRMAAEFIFHDYSIGSFAGAKRATRINLVNFTLNVYTHNFLNEALRPDDRADHKGIVGDTYPTRFSSFGLAAISFPTDRLHSACASRLAHHVLESWQRDLAEDALEQLFLSLLNHEDVRFLQGRHERRDGAGLLDRNDVDTALLEYDADAGKTLGSFLWEKAQAVRTEIEAAAAGNKGTTLQEHRNLLERYLAKEDSDNPSEWGEGVRLIESNMRAYIERLRTGIEKRAAELADDPHMGVAPVLSLLRELKSVLRNDNYRYLPHFETELTRWRDETQFHAVELDQIRMEIERHEAQFLFRSADLRRDLDQLVVRGDSDETGTFYNYFFSRVMKQVAKRGRQVCEAIDEFLGKDDPTGAGLIGRYYNLLAGFERLKGRLEAKRLYFEKPEKCELVVNLYREEDAERWYRTWVGDGDKEAEALRLFGNQLLKDVFEVDSVTAALLKIQRTPIEEIEQRMLEHCKAYFVSQSEQPEALSLLWDPARFSHRQREDAVRSAYNLAKVWLKMAELGLEHTGIAPVRADQRPCMIGLDTSAGARLRDFQELIIRTVQAPGDSPPSFLNIGEQHRGTIVFYNELAGVPAFFPSSVTSPNGLRKAYAAYADKDDLHTDKNRFQFGDLIPKTDAEARRYANAIKAFVLARLLGVLRVKEHKDDPDRLSFTYSYKRETGIRIEEVALGDELNAVDFLYRDARAEANTDREILVRQVEESLQELKHARLLWVYGLLLEFYMKIVYPPTDKGELLPNVSITQYSPEYAVLTLAESGIKDILASDAEYSQLRSAIEAGRGKPRGQDLTYEEYVAVLRPHCRAAGKFPRRQASALGHVRFTYAPVLAFDLSKLDTARKPAVKPLPRPPVTTPEPPRARQVEPCLKCGESIDVRATYCTHCRQTLGTHVTCPHCQEPQVPSYRDMCWKCGSPMREVARVECPQCFTFSGTSSEFPCPVCGYDPEAKEAPAETEPPAVSVRPSIAASAVGAPPAVASPSAAPPADPHAASANTANTKVECPSCFSTVDPGPRCSECGASLS